MDERFFEILPSEIIETIFDKLALDGDIKAFCSASCVCHKWFQISQNDALWKRLWNGRWRDQASSFWLANGLKAKAAVKLRWREEPVLNSLAKCYLSEINSDNISAAVSYALYAASQTCDDIHSALQVIKCRWESEYIPNEVLEQKINFVRGYLNALNGNLEAAKNHFLNAIHRALKSETTNNFALFPYYLEVPRFFRLAGDIKAAVEHLRNAIELWKKAINDSSDNSEEQINTFKQIISAFIVDSFIDFGMFSAALKELESLPLNIRTISQYLLCFFQLENSPEMIRTKLIPLLTKDPQFRPWLSFVYYVLGDTDKVNNDVDADFFADLRGVTRGPLKILKLRWRAEIGYGVASSDIPLLTCSSWNCPVIVNERLHVVPIRRADPFISVVIDPDTGIVLGSSPYYLLNRSPTITIVSSIASYSLCVPVYVLPLFEDRQQELRVLYIGSKISPRIIRQGTYQILLPLR
jgi:tetratricopeptide (TPR) repeat protein